MIPSTNSGVRRTGNWQQSKVQTELSDSRREYNFPMTSTGNVLFRYGGAVALVGMAVMLSIWVTPTRGVEQPSAILLMTVGLTGWLLGLGPALLSVFLSIVVLSQIEGWGAIPIAGEIVFLLEALGVAILVESQRRANHRWREKENLAGKLLNEYELE